MFQLLNNRDKTMSKSSDISTDVGQPNTHGTEGYDQTIFDANHWLRRNFRLFIDGSYYGYNDYRNNCEFLTENYEYSEKLRSFVINKFCQMIATDYECSVSTAQKAIVKSMHRVDLEMLNVELIDDARDLVREEIEEVV